MAGCSTDGGDGAGTDVPVTGVSLNKDSTTIFVGSTEQLTATVEPPGATDKSVTWSSTSDSVATVDADGTVHPVSEGSVDITVTTTDGGFQDTCAVTTTKLGPEIGPFENEGAYTVNRGWHASCIYNGYLYVTGGSYSGNEISSVEYAAVDDDGTLGSFSETTALPTGRAYHRCIGYKNRLYIVAGFLEGASDPTGTVLYADIQTDGTVGSFQQASGVMNTPRAGFGMGVYNDMLYVMGGTIGGHGTRSVEYAPIGTDGDVGSFTEIADALTYSRSFCAGAVFNGCLYAVGGRKSGSESHDTVEYALIQQDGNPGPFTTAAETLGTPREIFDVAVYNGWLYAVAGYDITPDPPTDTDTIEYAALNEVTGSPGVFQYTAESLPLALFHHSAQAYRHRLYVMGGYGSQKTVYSAPFVDN
jgi:hypothetical protein